DQPGEKADIFHWDSEWAVRPRLRLPLSVTVGIRDIKRLLRKHVRPGMSFLEIGCAPGKILAWIAKVLGADVAGLDYSPRGMQHAFDLFRALNIVADLRNEDIFETTFPSESFDIVYSAGVIEHFRDPRPIVHSH